MLSDKDGHWTNCWSLSVSSIFTKLDTPLCSQDLLAAYTPMHTDQCELDTKTSEDEQKRSSFTVEVFKETVWGENAHACWCGDSSCGTSKLLLQFVSIIVFPIGVIFTHQHEMFFQILCGYH